MNGLTFVVPLLVIAALIGWACLHRPHEDRMPEAWLIEHREREGRE